MATNPTTFYATVEQWITAEWSWVRANIALHPYLAVGLSVAFGTVVGHIL